MVVSRIIYNATRGDDIDPAGAAIEVLAFNDLQ